MSILGLQKLLLILGSKAAVEFRDRVLECFNRVLAGDRTLVREITANAAQDGPVQQIARAALAEQAAEDRIEAGECLELEVADRRLALKRKAEEWDLELAERRMRLTERQMALEHNKTTFGAESGGPSRSRSSIQQQKLELAEHWMRCMQTARPQLARRRAAAAAGQGPPLQRAHDRAAAGHYGAGAGRSN
jgi:hypothetical protein